MTVDVTREGPPEVPDGFEQVVTVDITSLDQAGTEPFDAGMHTGIKSPESVEVLSQEDESYRITWDHVNDQFDVVNVADGTDVAQGTDVGEVRIRVQGPR